MRCIPVLSFLLLAFTASASASATTWDDIARLEAHKHAQQVNLRDWKIVTFC